MPDINKESSEFWNAIKPMIDEEIKAQTRGMVQRRKMKVTTAPSLITNLIGVTEPFGSEILVPFTTNLISASVGDYVWVEYMYGMSNAFASMFASADDKNRTVGGDLYVMGDAGVGGNFGVSGNATFQDATVNGNLDIVKRRCSATIPSGSAGWYRVLNYSATSSDNAIGRIAFDIRIKITTSYGGANNELHEISLLARYNSISFANEVSSSASGGITKVRYSTNGSKGYVDIYYNFSSSNDLTTNFDIAISPNHQAEFSALAPVAVADSPSGETIVTSYNFHANGTYSDNFTADVLNTTALNGVLNVGYTTISNGSSGSITIPNSTSAFLLVTGIQAASKYMCAVRCNSGGTVSHVEFGSPGATFTTSTNTLTIANSSGGEMQILILRF